MRRRTFLNAAAATAVHAEAEPDASLRLWYKQPAPDWNEALPIGNGRLGAMIFGGVAEERLQLNDNTLYSGAAGQRDLPLDIAPDCERVVQMLRNREFAEAEELIGRKWVGRAQACYQPLGDLHLAFEDHTSPRDYMRKLDLRTAIATVRYTHGGVVFTRECFASFPDKAIAIPLIASRPGGLNFHAVLSSIHATARTRAQGSDSHVLTGQVPGLALRRTLEWVEQRGEQWKYPELWDHDGQRRPGAKPVLYGNEISGIGMRFEAQLRASLKGRLGLGRLAGIGNPRGR